MTTNIEEFDNIPFEEKLKICENILYNIDTMVSMKDTNRLMDDFEKDNIKMSMMYFLGMSDEDYTEMLKTILTTHQFNRYYERSEMKMTLNF